MAKNKALKRINNYGDKGVDRLRRNNICNTDVSSRGHSEVDEFLTIVELKHEEVMEQNN